MKSIESSPAGGELPSGIAVSFHERLAAGRRVLAIGICGAGATALVVAGLLGSATHRSDRTTVGLSATSAAAEADFYETRLIAESRAAVTTRSSHRLTDVELLENRLLAEARGLTNSPTRRSMTEVELLEQRLLWEARREGI